MGNLWIWSLTLPDIGFNIMAMSLSSVGLAIGLPMIVQALRKELGRPKLNYRPKPEPYRRCRYKLRAQLPWQV